MSDGESNRLEAESADSIAIATTDVPAGALYVALGSVTARAIAGAVAARDPGLRAYLRHVLLTAILVVASGIAAVAAAIVLF